MCLYVYVYRSLGIFPLISNWIGCVCVFCKLVLVYWKEKKKKYINGDYLVKHSVCCRENSVDYGKNNKKIAKSHALRDRNYSSSTDLQMFDQWLMHECMNQKKKHWHGLFDRQKNTHSYTRTHCGFEWITQNFITKLLDATMSDAEMKEQIQNWNYFAATVFINIYLFDKCLVLLQQKSNWAKRKKNCFFSSSFCYRNYPWDRCTRMCVCVCSTDTHNQWTQNGD